MSPRATLYCGDALAVLKTLPAESVQCVVTSPPYFGLRDYGLPSQVWGGDPSCAHEWGEPLTVHKGGPHGEHGALRGGSRAVVEAQAAVKDYAAGAFCGCGAWRGALGLEPIPELYVEHIVELFREGRRVLRADGSLWLNLGDKWASGDHGGGGSFMADRGEAWAHAKDAKGWRSPPAGYKDKDLVGIPWMTAFALRADGWFLRQCNIWAKPNCMPESVDDRSTVSHEYVFHLTKSNDYFYDKEAARTPAAPSSETRLAQNVEAQAGSVRGNGGAKTNGPMKAVRRKALPETQAKLGAYRDKQRGHSRRHAGFNDRWDQMERDEQVAAGANLRSVWWIAPAQYHEAHFAVMPVGVAEICILAGSRPGDVVLDPFGGSGTTAAVATGHGRSAIYVDLNPAYLELARQRIGPMLCDEVPA